MFCPDRRTLGHHLDGADADYLVAPLTSCLPVPDPMSDDVAALVACNFGTAFAGLRKLRLGVGARLAVFGLGPVGCCLVALAANAGTEVLAVDPVDARRRLAGKLGAAHLLDPSDGPAADQIKHRVGSPGPEAVADCSANATAQAEAMATVRPKGSVLLLGANTQMDLDPGTHVIRKELTIHGSWVYKLPEYEAVLRAVMRIERISTLVTDVYPADRAAEAVAAAAGGSTGKVVIRWTD